MDRFPVEKKSILTEELRESKRLGKRPRSIEDVSTPSRDMPDQPSSEILKEHLDQICDKMEYLNHKEQEYVNLIKKYTSAPRKAEISELQSHFEQGFLHFLREKMPEETNQFLVGVLKEMLEDITKREKLRKAKSDGIEELEQPLKLKESTHLENQLKKDETKVCDDITRLDDILTAYHYKPLQITDKQISLIQKYIRRGDMKPKHILDTNVSIDRYNEMSSAFRGEQNLETRINYAIKSQSNKYLLRDLMRNGLAREKEAGQSRFGMDAASKGEIKKCIHAARAIGIDAREICSRITLSNPNMQQKDINYALTNGVRSFVVQDRGTLELLYKRAKKHGVEKKVEIITRISGPPNAQKTAGEKFGADLETCKEMLQFAHDHKMKPTGMAVHVGWQVDNAEQMEERMNYALEQMAQTFKNMKEKHGVKLSILDLGGGWPNQFRGKPVPSISENAKIVKKLMDKHFEDEKPTLILEPGNYLSAAAGVTKAHIINIGKVPNKPGMQRCVLDVGKFNGGLVDGHYPVSMMIDGKAVEALVDVPPDQESQHRIVMFGPSCDSSDTVIDNVMLSDNPEVHKRFEQMMKANSADNGADQHIIVFHGTGAYTSEYNVGKVGEEGFNSIRNPELVIISRDRVREAGVSSLQRLLRGLAPRLSHRVLRSQVSRLWRTAVGL